ncbi:MAG TPA: hypothetical protein ACQGQF_03380 [Xylella fastidiosa subsp. pauca]
MALLLSISQWPIPECELMHMPYSPTTIANYFLRRASQEGRALTSMLVFNLVYIAHAWHLGFGKQPLIDEHVLNFLGWERHVVGLLLLLRVCFYS